jgi:hypothetical protein
MPPPPPFFPTAEHYLSSQGETGDLYSESYEKVAVLFASIPDYMDSSFTDSDFQRGVACLTMLNEIIASFDRVQKHATVRQAITNLLALYSSCLKSNSRGWRKSR